MALNILSMRPTLQTCYKKSEVVKAITYISAPNLAWIMCGLVACFTRVFHETKPTSRGFDERDQTHRDYI